MTGHASRDAVRGTYDRIAGHFSRTRNAPWPEVREFVETAGSAVRTLDIGCGNGRHIPLLRRASREVIGLDFSRGALEEARDRVGPETSLIQAEAGNLPVQDDSIDLALYVATLHHLPHRGARVESLDELARVLAPTGRALIGVWSVTDDRFDFEDGQDRVIPWTLPDGETVERFYHIYDRGDIERELAESRLAVRSLEASSGNWYADVVPE